jgi:hypothetical protein
VVSGHVTNPVKLRDILMDIMHKSSILVVGASFMVIAVIFF